MHDAILHAIEANTAAVQALYRHLHFQLVTKADLRIFGCGIVEALESLASEVHGQNEAALKSVIKKLDKAGDGLKEAVENNQPEA